MALDEGQTFPVKLNRKDGSCEIICTETDKVLNKITDEQALFLLGEAEDSLYNLVLSFLVLGHDFAFAYNEATKLHEKAKDELIMKGVI